MNNKGRKHDRLIDRNTLYTIIFKLHCFSVNFQFYVYFFLSNQLGNDSHKIVG